MNDPRFVFVHSIPRSGTMWFFNTVRCLWEAADIPWKHIHLPHHEFYRIDVFQRIIHEPIANGSRLIMTAHFPSMEMMDMVSVMNGMIFCLRRDPRDCVASLQKQWGFNIERAFSIIKSCHIAVSFHGRFDAKTFRYEDGYTNDIQTLYYLCDALDLSLEEYQIQKVFDELRPEKVRALIETYEQTGVFDNSKEPINTWHPITSWHPHHVGDGATNKYKRLLTDDQIDHINNRCQEYLEIYGYDK